MPPSHRTAPNAPAICSTRNIKDSRPKETGENRPEQAAPPPEKPAFGHRLKKITIPLDYNG
jgi:hypothetical protein